MGRAILMVVIVLVMVAPTASALGKDGHGELMHWKEAKMAVPVKSVFTIRDVETGWKFRVQRRAGDKHADVQPVTLVDTAIMKKIYGGEWSWQRRAVVVEYGGMRIAASMNGMPHGGDGIPDNAFNGHFCVHFFGSTTHGSNNIDIQHQLMVRKAAGQLEAYLSSVTAAEVVNAFFVALKNGDERMLRMTFINPNGPEADFFAREMQKLQAIRIDWLKEKAESADQLVREIGVRANELRRGEGEERIDYRFTLIRTSVGGPWRISSISMAGDGR